MSAATATIPETVRARLHDAAIALTGALLAEDSWSIEDDLDGAEITNARAIVAPLGPKARFGLIMASPLARRLIVGPPPADSLIEALEPGVAAVAASLQGLIEGIAAGEPREATVAEALDSMGGDVLTVKLLDGTTHEATFVLVTASSLAQAEAAAADAPTFEQIPDGPTPLATHPVSMLSDVEMGVTVELGRARMTVGEILGLTIGSVIELDRIAGSPVDVLVNGTLIARGEVVVVDEEFGVRVSEVLGYQTPERPRR